MHALGLMSSSPVRVAASWQNGLHPVLHFVPTSPTVIESAKVDGLRASAQKDCYSADAFPPIHRPPQHRSKNLIGIDRSNQADRSRQN